MTTSIPGALVGARLASYISGPFLRRFSGGIMLLSVPFILNNAKSKKEEEGVIEALVAKNKFRYDMLKDLTPQNVATFCYAHADLVALGLVTGLLSGMIGIGGGIVMNSYLGSMTEMPQHEIIATSLLVAVPIGVSGSLVHVLAGRIDVKSSALLVGSSLIAMGATSRFVGDIDDTTLKRIFSALVAISSISMLR